jgi:hypothetical protein
MFKLISLVRDFSQLRTISIYELLQQTGYPKIADQITEQDIYKELLANQSFVNDWLEYSEDKRTDKGWYFKQAGDGKYLVGCVGNTGTIETVYDDKIKAGSKFIKQELDVIAK